MSKQLSYYHENKVRIAKRLKEKYANDKEFREEKKRISKRQQKNAVPLRKNEKIIPDDERKKYNKTPIQVEIEVAIGMIINPYFLNKPTLIAIFINITISEI